MAYFQKLMPKLIAIVKPEAEEEIKEAIEHFASQLNK